VNAATIGAAPHAACEQACMWLLLRAAGVRMKSSLIDPRLRGVFVT
jgi:hypothetical protein